MPPSSRTTAPPSHNNFSCHVCGKREPVGIWQDPDGNPLQACDWYPCTVGYEFICSMKLMLAIRDELSGSRDKALDRIRVGIFLGVGKKVGDVSEWAKARE